MGKLFEALHPKKIAGKGALVDKEWICERTYLATQTVIIKAPSRKTALEKLKKYRHADGDDCQAIDMHHSLIKSRRVVREDK